MRTDPPKKPASPEEQQDVLAQLRAELAAIETRYGNPELKAELGRFMKQNGYVQGPPGRTKSTTSKGNGFVRPLNVLPDYEAPADHHLVRYFLMEALARTGHDIVISEFAYMKNCCDVFAVASGRAIEYEIKSCREDYFRDFQKTIFMGHPVSKHGALAAGSTMISRFYFVVPANMVDIRECPAHAGLIWYELKAGVPVFRVIKRPAMLTKQYLSPGSWQTIAKRLMIRSRNLTDRYTTTRFRDLKNASIYAHRNIDDSAAHPG